MLQHFNPINQIQIFPKIADRKLFFGLFYHPIPLFVIPPFVSFWGCVSNRRIPSFYETLRLKPSGWQIKSVRVTKKESFCPFSVIPPLFCHTTLFVILSASFTCHSEGALATEESPPFSVILPFLFLSFWGSVSDRRIPSGDPSAKASGWQKRGTGWQRGCHSERPFILSFWASAKNPIRSSFFSLKFAIKDSSGHFAPQNDKKGEQGDKEGVILRHEVPKNLLLLFTSAILEEHSQRW